MEDSGFVIISILSLELMELPCSAIHAQIIWHAVGSGSSPLSFQATVGQAAG